MRSRQGEEFETYHLTCPVCAALPGTSCIDEEYQELARVHPSRRVSVAERNRRRDASGWEPPELAERRLRRHQAIARAPLSDPTLSPDVTAAQEGPGTRSRAEPGQGPCPSGAARKAALAATAEVSAEAVGSPAVGGVRSQLVAHLSGYPEGAAVPRQKLRDIASSASTAVNGPVLVSQGRRTRRRTRGLSSNSSKGSRSSERLAAYLKSLEDLGLVRRDHHRDAVFITDPVGLRKLRDALGGL
jgi:hypothetical protein